MIRSNSLTSAQRALFVLQVLAIIGFFALACGCSSGSSKKRSKLSEAAAEAEKEPAQRETQKRKEKKKDEDTPTLYVPEEEDDDDGGFDDVMVGVVLTDDPEPQPVAQQDSGVDFLHFGLLIGGGTLAGSDYDGFALIGLQFGVYNPKLRVGADIAVLGMPMNITEAAAGVGGLTNEGEFAVELSVRRYLTPDRSDLGVYITGGFRFGVLIWDYENPIEVDVGGTTETIQSDFLKTYGLNLGLGTSIGSVKHFHVGVQGLAGVRFYSGTTDKGFDNDIFDTEAFLQFALEITFSSFKAD